MMCPVDAAVLQAAVDGFSMIALSLTTLKPTAPRIATMTVGCKAGQQVDVAAVEQQVDRHTSPFVKGSKGLFRNSLLLSLPKQHGKGRFGVKVFRNGAIHLTGLQAVEQLTYVSHEIEHLLVAAMPGSLPKLHEFKWQLINCNFAVGCRLNLAAINDMVCRSPSTTLYSRGIGSQYPALVIKVPTTQGCRPASVHLFTTGSALITGIKQPADLLTAFGAIMALLDAHASLVVMPEAKAKRPTKKDRYASPHS
jgi:TATA-box binding protein (TBP) (component of TFIID and TFIIIB)